MKKPAPNPLSPPGPLPDMPAPRGRSMGPQARPDPGGWTRAKAGTATARGDSGRHPSPPYPNALTLRSLRQERSLRDGACPAAAVLPEPVPVADKHRLGDQRSVGSRWPPTVREMQWKTEEPGESVPPGAAVIRAMRMTRGTTPREGEGYMRRRLSPPWGWAAPPKESVTPVPSPRISRVPVTPVDAPTPRRSLSPPWRGARRCRACHRGARALGGPGSRRNPKA